MPKKINFFAIEFSRSDLDWPQGLFFSSSSFTLLNLQIMKMYGAKTKKCYSMRNEEGNIGCDGFGLGF